MVATMVLLFTKSVFMCVCAVNSTINNEKSLFNHNTDT